MTVSLRVIRTQPIVISTMPRSTPEVREGESFMVPAAASLQPDPRPAAGDLAVPRGPRIARTRIRNTRRRFSSRRLRGNDGKNVRHVMPAGPVPAKAGSGYPLIFLGIVLRELPDRLQMSWRRPCPVSGRAASANHAAASPVRALGGVVQLSPNSLAYAASRAFQPGRSTTSRLTMPVGTRPAMTAMTARTSAAPLPAKS